MQICPICEHEIIGDIALFCPNCACEIIEPAHVKKEIKNTLNRRKPYKKSRKSEIPSIIQTIILAGWIYVSYFLLKSYFSFEITIIIIVSSDLYLFAMFNINDSIDLWG